MRDSAGPPEASVVVQAITQLPWLAPSAASLAALARSTGPSFWPSIRTDPAAVLLLLRHGTGSYYAAEPSSPASLPITSGLFQTILVQLNQPAVGLADWGREPARTAYLASLGAARLAEELARRTGACDPDRAWVCGLLAPLGWLVLAAVPATLARILETDPRAPWTKRWQGLLGIDPQGLARRIARRWGLPSWLAHVIGRLDLAEPLARRFGTDPALFHVTRAAVGLTQGPAALPGQAAGEAARDSLHCLGLAPTTAEEDWVRQVSSEATRSVPAWQSPYDQPLLPDLLAAAAENARLRGAPLQQGLEEEVDQLHRALAEQVCTESDRLHVAKLEALAEFAAGAGHEINNPLAVISGQAQYLLGHEDSWFAGEAQPHVRKALQAIIGQTRRMHGVLRDLIQFARPAAPSVRRVDLPGLLAETAAGLQELAAQRRVRIELDLPGEPLTVCVDADQVRVAAGCLLRNAIEAAPAEGWARVAVGQPGAGRPVDVVIEDSGPGPDPLHRPHLFDPFFSGRSAGRGRGLGLPMAWRLARQQGGDVRLEPTGPGQPTRFVLSLPQADAPDCNGSGHRSHPPLPDRPAGLTLLAS